MQSPQPHFLADEIDPELLRRVGRHLHAGKWMAALAQDLGVTDEVVFGWLTGEMPVRGAGLRERLGDLVLSRRADADRMLAELRPSEIPAAA
ncbi:hypothetical protein ACEUZ9_002761 [Paracoccus litorisediminis]|uniref:hypothetical protein n=1 Tax=Paracoccus litorisediminis TaxID=2006130 RepID=UPI0037346AB1